MSPYTPIILTLRDLNLTEPEERRILDDLLTHLQNLENKWTLDKVAYLTNEDTSVFTLDDRSQVLYRRYGLHSTVAFRPHVGATWGIPYDGERRH